MRITWLPTALAAASLWGTAAFVSAAEPYTRATPLPAPYSGHALVATKSFLYNFGGMEGLTGIFGGNRLYYAPITAPGQIGAWTRGPDLPEAVFFHSGVAWNGAIYAIGGYHYNGSGVAVSDKVYISRLGADGIPGAWEETAPLPASLFLHSAAVWNGIIYVTGGWGRDSLSGGVFSARIQPDGTLGGWTPQPALPVGTYAHAAVQSGTLYVLGGSIDNGAQITNTVYHSKINADGDLMGWAVTTPLPEPLADHAAAVVGGQVAVAGGWNGSAAVSATRLSVIGSDKALGGWQEAPALPSLLYLHSGAASGGYFFVSGGSDLSAPQSGVYSMLVENEPPPPPPPPPDPPPPPPPPPPVSAPPVAAVDLNPNTLNLASRGRFITAYVEFMDGSGAGYNVVASSLRVMRINGAAPSGSLIPESSPTSFGDGNGNGVRDLMVKFDRAAFAAQLGTGDNVIDFEGEFSNGSPFKGRGTIWAVSPHDKDQERRAEKARTNRDIKAGKHGFRLITSEGGELEVEGSRKVKVSLPAGAVSAGVGVTALVDADSDPAERSARQAAMGAAGLRAAGPHVSFGPEGTSFREPVTLELGYDAGALSGGSTEEELAVHYWNAAAGAWEALESTVDPVNKVVRAQTSHFSVYQVLAVVPAPAAVALPLAAAAAPPAPAPPVLEPVAEAEPAIAVAVVPATAEPSYAERFPGAQAQAQAPESSDPPPVLPRGRRGSPRTAASAAGSSGDTAGYQPVFAAVAASVADAPLPPASVAGYAAAALAGVPSARSGAQGAADLARYYREKAEEAVAEGRLEEGYALLEAASLWSPDDGKTARRLLALRKALVKVQEQAEPAVCLQDEDAARAYRRGELLASRNLWLACLEEAPAHPQARAYLGKISARLSSAERSRLAKARASRRQAQKSAALLAQANRAMALGLWALAQRKAEEAALWDPTGKTSRALIARLDSARKASAARGLAEAERLLTVGRHAAAYLLLQEALLQDPRNQAAAAKATAVKADLNKVLTPAERKRAQRLYYQAVDQYLKGHFKAAQSWTAQLLGVDPTYEPGWRLKAKAAAALGANSGR